MSTPDPTTTAAPPPAQVSRLWWPLGLVAGAAVLLLCVDVGVSAGVDSLGTATLVRIALVLGGLLAVLWLARFEYFLLAVLVVRPAVDISKSGGGPAVLSSGLAALVVLGVLLWLAAQLRAGTLERVSVLGRLLVVLLVVMTLSALGAQEQVRSVLQVARLAAAVAVFLAVEQMVRTTTAGRRRLLLACYASALVPLLIGLQQLATGTYLKESNGLGRVTGTFLHPNAFGFYLVLLLTMGAAVLRHLDGRARVLVALVLVAGAVELLLSYSRGSWVAVVVGLLVVGALQSRALLLAVPAGVALVPLVAPSVLTRLSDLSRAESINGTPGNSFLWRVDHWAQVLRGARGHAFLGIGPGSSDFLGEEVLPPHNDFVRMYVETGVLGTTVYAACLVAALVMAVRALRSVPAGGQHLPAGGQHLPAGGQHLPAGGQHLPAGGLGHGIAVGACACTLAFVVGSVGGNLISEVVVLLYLFAFLGLASGVGAQAPTARARADRSSHVVPPGPLPVGAGGER